MNKFQSRWLECAAKARQEKRAEDQPPCGFAARVLAAAREDAPPTLTDLLYPLILRSLGCATTLLVALAVFEAASTHNHRMKIPHIENTVAQVFWLL